jgi:hypothetical protein
MAATTSLGISARILRPDAQSPNLIQQLSDHTVNAMLRPGHSGVVLRRRNRVCGWSPKVTARMKTPGGTRGRADLGDQPALLRNSKSSQPATASR